MRPSRNRMATDIRGLSRHEEDRFLITEPLGQASVRFSVVREGRCVPCAY